MLTVTGRPSASSTVLTTSGDLVTVRNTTLKGRFNPDRSVAIVVCELRCEFYDRAASLAENELRVGLAQVVGHCKIVLLLIGNVGERYFAPRAERDLLLGLVPSMVVGGLLCADG